MRNVLSVLSLCVRPEFVWMYSLCSLCMSARVLVAAMEAGRAHRQTLPCVYRCVGLVLALMMIHSAESCGVLAHGLLSWVLP